jgi:uncharacterized membrane protein
MLTAYRIVNFLAVLSASMLAGLMTTLLTVMRRAWLDQTDAGAAASFKNFLNRAATNRVLSTLSITPVVSAIVMAFVAKPPNAHPRYAYIGGCVFFVGFYIWTGVFNLPIYKAVNAWNLSEAPTNTRRLILRFHLSNAVRLLASLATSALFFLAV